MATFLPMPDDYGDGLTDEERKRFLESFAPSPIHTGAVTRGVQGFAPVGSLAPMRADSTATPASRPPAVDSDLMRRFAEAQQVETRGDTLGTLGASLDNYARLYVGLPERQVPRSTRSPTSSVLEAEGLAAKQRATARQQELDAVNLDKTRAETQRAQAAAKSTEAEAKREAALADPKSRESAALRETAAALLVDQYGKPTIPPEKLATMSGQEIRESLKFGTSRLNADAQAFIGQQRVNNEQRANEVAAWLRKEGLETQYDIAALMAELRESEGQKNRELQEVLAKYKVDTEKEKSARERGEKLAEREVGGFEFLPGRTPSHEGAKIMAAAAVQIGRIEGALANLRSLYAQHGTELFGTKAGLMESEFMAITNAARVMNDMGVPNGKDYEMLAKELQDPTTLRDLFTSKGRNLAKMDLMGQRMQNLANITAKVYGYRRESPRTGTASNPARSNPTYETPSGKPVEVDDLPQGKPQGAAAPAATPPASKVRTSAPPSGKIRIHDKTAKKGEGYYFVTPKRFKELQGRDAERWEEIP